MGLREYDGHMNEGYTIPPSPYAPEPTASFSSANDLFGNFHLVPAKKNQSERGELLRYFSQKTGKTIPHLCGRYIHPKLTLEDLYYIKSACDQYAARPAAEGGGPWGKAFFGMLKDK